MGEKGLARITTPRSLSMEVYNNEVLLYEWFKMITDDARWILFLYATKYKGITYRELGITRAYGNMIKNRKRRVTDELLEKILEKLTAKDLLLLTNSYNEYTGNNGARRLAWLGRRPDTAEVRGSNPRGPTIKHELF